MQDLFESSLDDLKLLSMPNPALFLSLEGHHHPMIVPTVQLDLSRVLIQISDETDSDSCHDGPASPMPLSESKTKKSVWEESPICRWMRSVPILMLKYLEDLAHQSPVIGDLSIVDSTGNMWPRISSLEMHPRSASAAGTNTPSTRNSLTSSYGGAVYESGGTQNRTPVRKPKSRPRLSLDLMAVVCKELKDVAPASRYTVFVRCANNPKRGWAPWVHYTPSDSHGHAVVRRADCDIGKSLRRIQSQPDILKSVGREMSTDVQRILTTCIFLIYTPKSGS